MKEVFDFIFLGKGDGSILTSSYLPYSTIRNIQLPLHVFYLLCLSFHQKQNIFFLNNTISLSPSSNCRDGTEHQKNLSDLAIRRITKRKIEELSSVFREYIPEEDRFF